MSRCTDDLRRPAATRDRAPVSVFLGLIGVALALGCPEPRWKSSPRLRAHEFVAAALDDHGYPTVRIEAEDVPELNLPRSLRPCCAFGTDLGVELGRVPVPGVHLSNVIGPQDVGPHNYDNGFLSLNARDARGTFTNEQNGLVYTCRGGFIDLAHVRDNADLTLGLISQIARKLDTGGVIQGPTQGAHATVHVQPVDPDAIDHHGRIRLATAIAQWVAFKFSVWHEIATWYGYASLASWPEKISAFSPEDLYSNAVGVKLGGGIATARNAGDDDQYNRTMDAWIETTLERLQALPVEQGKEAMRTVDGLWWDSSRKIPDWRLVKRRFWEIGPDLRPWLVDGPEGPPDAAPFAPCRDAYEPLALRVPDGFEGHAFRNHLRVEFEVSDELADQGFFFPREGSRVITQEDFPAIVEAIRRENDATYHADVEGTEEDGA